MLPNQVPFSKSAQLNNDLDYLDQPPPNDKMLSLSPILPGHPRIRLENSSKLTDFLESEFCSADLDAMAPHLWVMSTQSSANIEPLHRQRVKGREIIVTEEPRLHLVWFHDRIFIKPLPKYLLSHKFWTVCLLSDNSPLGNRRDAIREAALGFLRTYVYLIRHESDFHIAQTDELRLVPKLASWSEFCAFTSNFEDIKDSDVSVRYSYGELRLTRLNMCIKLFLGKWRFMRIHSQYSEYFARFYGPLLFAFGVVSIVLSAMQVEMAVEQLRAAQWRSFWVVCRWFSIVSLICIALISLALISLFAFRILDEWIYAMKDRRKSQRANRDASVSRA